MMLFKSPCKEKHYFLKNFLKSNNSFINYTEILKFFSIFYQNFTSRKNNCILILILTQFNKLYSELIKNFFYSSFQIYYSQKFHILLFNSRNTFYPLCGIQI